MFETERKLNVLDLYCRLKACKNCQPRQYYTRENFSLKATKPAFSEITLEFDKNGRRRERTQRCCAKK